MNIYNLKNEWPAWFSWLLTGRLETYWAVLGNKKQCLWHIYTFLVCFFRGNTWSNISRCSAVDTQPEEPPCHCIGSHFAFRSPLPVAVATHVSLRGTVSCASRSRPLGGARSASTCADACLVNGRVFLSCSFQAFADVRGVAHLEDLIIMLDFFLSLRLCGYLSFSTCLHLAVHRLRTRRRASAPLGHPIFHADARLIRANSQETQLQPVKAQSTKPPSPTAGLVTFKTQRISALLLLIPCRGLP
jgi:hypothetical protein